MPPPPPPQTMPPPPPPTPAPAPTPTLPDELLEEIFLRLPPDEPACLVRASLASRLWLGLLTGAAFRRRYTEFHGAPPMLGFLLSSFLNSDQEKHPDPHFVSTVKFGARTPDKSDWGHRKYDSLDCRHGRVLLANLCLGPTKLAVWDPITGCRRDLSAPHDFLGLGAAVLCAVTGCEHHACHEGPFRVLLFGLNMDDGNANVRVCSSETGEWSEPCSGLHLGSENAVIQPRPSVLLKNTLYHIVLYADHTAILKYDMGPNCMSLLDGPPGVVTAGSPILMTMEDGCLGFAYLDGLGLCLWSRQTRSDGVVAWTHCRVVNLKQLLLIQNPKKRLRLIGFKEDSGIIFVTTDLGIYEFNIKSLEWKKLWKREKIRVLIPYMSFRYPSERGTTFKAAH